MTHAPRRRAAGAGARALAHPRRDADRRRARHGRRPPRREGIDAGGRRCRASRSRRPTTTSAAPPTSSSPGSTRSASTVAGRLALDMGASTGGFTQVLRERGADPVIAVDVGHGQLAASVAADPGVISIEGFNVRYMTPESSGRGERRRRAPRSWSPATCRSSRSRTCCRPRARSPRRTPTSCCW